VQRTREPRVWLGTARILRQRKFGHIKVTGTVKTSIIFVVIQAIFRLYTDPAVTEYTNPPYAPQKLKAIYENATALTKRLYRTKAVSRMRSNTSIVRNTPQGLAGYAQLWLQNGLQFRHVMRILNKFAQRKDAV
jgi:hypothetical protein